MKKEDKSGVKIIIALVLIFLGFYYLRSISGEVGVKEVETIKGTWDITEQVMQNDYDKYLLEYPDIDISNPNIQSKAEEIKSTTKTPKEAVEKTMKFVANNVQYSSAITVNYCYEEKASDVLMSRKGDCVSMSRLVTALLRAQGIPARTMGGCLSFSYRCSPLFATVPGLETQTTAMQEGDFKKRGFLHEWVEVWTPSNGWQIIEATSGQAFDLECNTYLEYGYDNNKYNRCVINDNSFWKQCQVY